jgi:hypothetical protein
MDLAECVELNKQVLSLIDAGFIYVTRKGHMPSTCELLALTWFSLDVSPKFDPEALACFKSKAFIKKDTPPISTQKPKRDWTLPNGGRDEAFKIKDLVHLGNMDGATSPLMKH